MTSTSYQRSSHGPLCPRCSGRMIYLVSTTTMNPGNPFWKCPNKSFGGTYCGKMYWYDEYEGSFSSNNMSAQPHHSLSTLLQSHGSVNNGPTLADPTLTLDHLFRAMAFTVGIMLVTIFGLILISYFYVYLFTYLK